MLRLHVWLGPESIENENLARLSDFEFGLVQSTPSPENENLARLKDFRFELIQSTPLPKMKTWPDWVTLDLSWSRVPLCVKTNRCIPQGYRLIVVVTLSVSEAVEMEQLVRLKNRSVHFKTGGISYNTQVLGESEIYAMFDILKFDI